MPASIATINSRRLVRAAAVLAILLVCPAFAAQGLIYSVQREGAPASFLVGTMHSEDARVLALLDGLAPLIERVDVVAIEVLPDALSMLAAGAATLLPPDQDLRSLIGPERYAALEAVASRLGVPIDILNRLKPWAVAVMLGMPASDTGRFLDMQIYVRALASQRRTIGLETAAEQFAVFAEMTPDVELALLDEMIKNAPDLPKQLEILTAAYLAGDLQRLDALARVEYADMPAAVRQWFDTKLLDQRNLRMLSRLSCLLPRQSMFVAVGALHLGGATGLVAGLRGLGYRVDRWPG
jgi:hypothetical protein